MTTMDDIFVFPDEHGVRLDRIKYVSATEKLNTSTFSMESSAWFFSVYTNIRGAHWNAVYNSEFEAAATREALIGKLANRGVILAKFLAEVD